MISDLSTILAVSKSSQTKFVLILAVRTFTVALYVVSRLVLSPIITRRAAQQQLGVSWGGGWWSKALCSHSNSS